MQRLLSCLLPCLCQPPQTAVDVGWALLPTELLVLIAGYASFRGLLSLALVNRRLYQLVVHPDATVSHVSMWSNYPAVTFAVDVLAKGFADGCVVQVCGDSFDCAGHGVEYVSSLLSVLRHISDLRLIFSQQGSRYHYNALIDIPDPVFSTLHRLTQLRSLYVQGVLAVAATTFASALDSMPSLSILELRAYEMVRSEQLTAALYRLCSKQLNHLTLSRQQLYHLINHEPSAPMAHLQSLTAFLSEVSMADRIMEVYTAGRPRLEPFPSLLRLHVSCGYHFVHLKYPNSGGLADWANLLNVSAPPVFAPRLTHLSIRLYSHDTTAAAAMLPSLPAMYPSLTHVHVGVQDAYDAYNVQGVEWSVAVQAVQAAVGSAWCENEADVVSWRDDVAETCKAGLTAQN